MRVNGFNLAVLNGKRPSVRSFCFHAPDCVFRVLGVKDNSVFVLSVCRDHSLCVLRSRRRVQSEPLPTSVAEKRWTRGFARRVEVVITAQVRYPTPRTKPRFP
jgi:hypothetical protein